MKGRTDSILLINKEIAGAMEHVAHVSLRSWKVWYFYCKIIATYNYNHYYNHQAKTFWMKRLGWKGWLWKSRYLQTSFIFFRIIYLFISCKAAPPNYRWACRVQIAPDATQGGVVKVKLRPQTAVWDDGVTSRWWWTVYVYVAVSCWSAYVSVWQPYTCGINWLLF